MVHIRMGMMEGITSRESLDMRISYTNVQSLHLKAACANPQQCESSALLHDSLASLRLRQHDFHEHNNIKVILTLSFGTSLPRPG